MGTNYYARENICKECGRYDDIHLGKSSMGWKFTFQYNGGELYKTVPEMKKWLKGKRIFDEYGDEVSQTFFWNMVEEKQKKKTNMSHAEYVKEHYPGSMSHELLIDGYSFSDVEFS